jgi:diguanylate cyclase (GGDEF)-like protein/putative nucleotidyltransferase with HDIG domain
MTVTVKVYLALVISLGIMSFTAMAAWESEDMLRFTVIAVVALVGSRLKVRLPGIDATMSVAFFFILVGIVELKLSETLAVGIAGLFWQCIAQKLNLLRAVQLAFNFSVTGCSATIAYLLFHNSAFEQLPLEYSLRLAITSSVYFAANTVPVSGIVALTEGKNIIRVWRDCYFWSFPYYLVGAAMAMGFHVLSKNEGWQTAIFVMPVVYVIYRSYQLYLEQLQAEKVQTENQRKHAEEMSMLHLRTIEALALAIEAKDQTTHDHLGRVQVYALEVAKELNLPEEQLEAVRAAALLHDIGKLAVPEHIISKPGRLTPEEFEKMKIHPVVGAEILDRVQFPYPVVPIVRHHHEKWDGAGYPDGLRGEDIPIGARIIAAVDCLDALASDRQYRRALPLDEAMQVVIKESGTSFDPRIVEILARRYKELETMAKGTQLELGKLSTDVRVERGAAPAAGFVGDAAPASSRRKPDFLATIGAARHEAQVLFEMVQVIGQSLSLNETLSVLAMRLKNLIPYDSLAVYVKQEDHVMPTFVTGDEFRLFQSLRIPMGQGLSGWVAESGRPMVNGNPSVEPGYLNDPAKFSNLRSALSVPLEGTSGVVGVLSLYHAERDHFNSDHLRVLLAIASKLGVCVENSMRYQQAEDNATVDYLTELPNARALFDHLEAEVARCKAENAGLSVLVGDLNGFKAVNDRFGHLEGNRILQAVARQLRSACRETDYVARMGGDEFVIVVPSTPAEVMVALLDRLNLAVKKAGEEVLGIPAVSFAVGESRLGEDGERSEELLAAADKKMYANKMAMKKQSSATQDLANLVGHLAAEAVPDEASASPAPAPRVKITRSPSS